MQAFLARLRDLVASGPLTERPARVAVDLTDAPASVSALAQAMARHGHYVELDAFSMYSDEDGVVASLEDILGRALADAGGDPKALLHGIDPKKTLLLGADPGGMSVFGLAWSGDEAQIVVVEIEDPTEDNVVRRFVSPARFLDFVESQRREAGDADEDDAAVRDRITATIAALRGDTTSPTRPEPTPKVEETSPALVEHPKGGPSDPWAKAHALLGTSAVLSSDPTAAGRRVIVRRRGSTTTLLVEALDADGARRPVTIPPDPSDPAPDVYGVSVHPTEERALLCLGAPGRLCEVDLVTLETTMLHSRVGWSAGYLDRDHIATFTEGRIDLYRRAEGALGEALQSIACGGANMLVTPERCFVVSSQEASVRVFSLGPGGLADRKSLPVVGRKPFYLSALAKKGTDVFLGSCAWDGKWTFYRLP